MICYFVILFFIYLTKNILVCDLYIFLILLRGFFWPRVSRKKTDRMNFSHPIKNHGLQWFIDSFKPQRSDICHPFGIKTNPSGLRPLPLVRGEKMVLGGKALKGRHINSPWFQPWANMIEIHLSPRGATYDLYKFSLYFTTKFIIMWWYILDYNNYDLRRIERKI